MKRTDIRVATAVYAYGENYQRTTFVLRPVVLLANDGDWRRSASGSSLCQYEAVRGSHTSLPGLAAVESDKGEQHIAKMLALAPRLAKAFERDETRPTVAYPLMLKLISPRHVHSLWEPYVAARTEWRKDRRDRQQDRAERDEAAQEAYLRVRKVLGEHTPAGVYTSKRGEGPHSMSWVEFERLALRYVDAVSEQHRSEHT